MCPLVVVLFPVKNGRVSITELPAAVFTLVDLPHPVRGEVLLQVGGGGEGLLTELALPWLVLVVDSLDVNPHVVASHEQFWAVRAGHARRSFLCLLLSGPSALTLLHTTSRSRSRSRSNVLTHHELTALYPATAVDHRPAVNDRNLLAGLESDAGHGLLYRLRLHYVHVLLLL